ncbi:MAG: hypothetical protein LBV34_14990 [Nocardiopsaceae bacterium]|jgi:hypothetical protein|nr:hypothetical protein [Nocardiopsaceae bacterium]
MLNHIWTAEAAMPARMRIRAGASFIGGCAAVSRERTEPLAAGTVDASTAAASTGAASTGASATVVAGLRPQASASPVFLGNAAHAAGKAILASQQRISHNKYARTTRIATQGGGALGPHQAWDPV